MAENKYLKQLYEVIHRNQMFDYEETSMVYIAAKLVQLLPDYGRCLSLILRSDIINADTYWFIRYFRSKNVEPSGILTTASNKGKYPEGIMGIPVIVIDEISKRSTKNDILITINRESDTKEYTQVDYRESDYGFCLRARGNLQFARKRGIDNYFHILCNEDRYKQTLELLEDDESKRTFIEVIRCLVENDIYRYHEYQSEIKYFDDAIYESLGKNEVWINCGSCLGDTILHYLAAKRDFKKIYAVEIDSNSVRHMKKILGLFPQNLCENIVIIDKPLEGKNGRNNIDCIFQNEKISLLNMDIEGAEMTVLEGASEKIKLDNPVLAVAAYHRPNDLLAIPEFLKRLNGDYHIYFRKYRGYCPEVVNEYIYYAIPTERMKK